MLMINSNKSFTMTHLCKCGKVKYKFYSSNLFHIFKSSSLCRVVTILLMYYILDMLRYRLYSFWTRFTFNITILKMALLAMKDVEIIENSLDEFSNPEVLKRILKSLRNSQKYFRRWKSEIYPLLWRWVVSNAMQKTFKLILKLEDRIESLENKQI